MLDWQVTPYTIPLIAAVVLSAAIAGYGLVRVRQGRADRSVTAFAALMLGLTMWTIGDAMQLSSTSLGAKSLWRLVAYTGQTVVPITLFAFAATFADDEQWGSRWAILFLSIPPLVIAVVVIPTNAIHGLLWPSFELATYGSFVVLDRTFGPAYWANTAYNYALVIGALGLLGQVCRRPERIYRRQGALFIGAVMLPFVANIAWVTGLTPVDLTAVTFAGTGLIFVFAIFRFQLFSRLPVARDTVLREMRDGVVVLSEEDEILDLNPAATEIMPSRRVAGGPLETVAPALVPAVEGHEPGTVHHDAVELGPSENPRHVEVTVSDFEEEGASGRLLLLRDVTERRRIEQRSRSLIENASEAVAILDKSGQVDYASPATEPVMGRPPEELIGESAFEHIHPDDIEAVMSEFEWVLVGPGKETSVEYRFHQPDGSWRWLDSRGKNLTDVPAIDGIVVSTRDVTERREREERLAHQNERLDEFARVLSHDLRNPLNVAQGYIDLLGTEDEIPGTVETIEQSLDRMGRLIDNLLTMARNGGEIQELQTVSIDDAAWEAWRHVETGGSSLAVDDDAGIEADRERLLRTFENLFRNAVEHGSTADQSHSRTGDGGLGVAVRVGAHSDGFYVADDGPGIPPDDREAVFTSGFSTDNEGTGLGLTIVREVAKAHGWSVTATESEAGGARFEFMGVAVSPDSAVEPPRKVG